jgi:hypothetical protein
MSDKNETLPEGVADADGIEQQKRVQDALRDMAEEMPRGCRDIIEQACEAIDELIALKTANRETTAQAAAAPSEGRWNEQQQIKDFLDILAKEAPTEEQFAELAKMPLVLMGLGANWAKTQMQQKALTLTTAPETTDGAKRISFEEAYDIQAKQIASQSEHIRALEAERDSLKSQLDSLLTCEECNACIIRS